ncbi:hypothetical protein M409DRAFT_71040 [Zasmidium cellare ATCC 36951]|uniref:Inositol polyphosphate-related phosphatase domain-containing protein n=1 Tax=Zasmidium cellare ATCC 36951 TaxID=1080233 RepID=A0A6A6BXD0_ZASCE|nr:uncharacterized protein M409DRAFT_71040 [Zasmidium cellare ATCC 36951]KAF2159365.1 hypothetical protein M409DRAFT_71040 [Zasmidium cellare ATCC 36951]
MADLNCHITTFNAGRTPIDINYFASSLYTSLKQSTLPPDLIVLALQELAPIGYSFLGGSLLTPYFSRFAEAVYKAAAWRLGKDADYEHVLTRNAGMTGIMVFARRELKQRIQWIEEAGTGVGLWDMGNKGAVGVRLGLDKTPVTFVAAHLAPIEAGCERRNEDWRRICENLVFEPINENPTSTDSERQPLLSNNPPQSSAPHDLFTPPSYIFFAGDLNYRTSDTQPDPADFTSWPQPMASPSDPTHWSKLLASDQLTREINSGKTLHHLAEAQITFPPTYKYSSRAQKLAGEAAETHKSKASNDSDDETPAIDLTQIQEQVWLWAKHRIPSWCDRILYLNTAPSTIHSYTALPIQPTSDHRPVVLSCSIPQRPLHESQVIQYPRYELDDGWKERRILARRLEVAIGVGAYLGFTGQGQILLGGTVVGIVVGYLVLQYLVGG